MGRYEVRNMIMGIPGAVAPVVFGGKIRAVLAYLDREQMQARGSLAARRDERARRGQRLLAQRRRQDRRPRLRARFQLDVSEISGTWAISRFATKTGARSTCGTWRPRRTPTTSRRTWCGSTASARFTFRSIASSVPARLKVVTTLNGSLKKFEERLTKSGISLKLVMDQSVYVRKSIEALVQEGVLGAILCSLVILLFLGELRMTAIAIMTLPISVMACCAACISPGQTINVMTLAGMTLAIGPMIDSAIICLENTHRHLGLGATTHEAAFLGASEVAMPELVSTLVHVPGALAAGADAGPGAVPLQADGDGGGVLDDRGVHPLADAGAGL